MDLCCLNIEAYCFKSHSLTLPIFSLYFSGLIPFLPFFFFVGLFSRSFEEKLVKVNMVELFDILFSSFFWASIISLLLLANNLAHFLSMSSRPSSLSDNFFTGTGLLLLIYVDSLLVFI